MLLLTFYEEFKTRDFLQNATLLQWMALSQMMYLCLERVSENSIIHKRYEIFEQLLESMDSYYKSSVILCYEAKTKYLHQIVFKSNSYYP